MASIEEKLAKKYSDINDEHKEVSRRLETWLSSKYLAHDCPDSSKCKHKPSLCGLDTYHLYTYNASQFKDRFRWYSDVSVHIADRLSRELVRERDRTIAEVREQSRQRRRALPSPRARALFIRSLPLDNANHARILGWLLSWFADGEIHIGGLLVDLVLRLHFWDSQWLRAKDTVDGRWLAPPHIRNMIAGKGLSDVQVAAFTDDIKVALNTEEEREEEYKRTELWFRKNWGLDQTLN